MKRPRGTEPVLWRVRDVVGTRGIEQLGPDAGRLLLRAVLFDGGGVPDWHQDARCAQIGGDGFFPSLTALGEVAAAKRVCAGCPVRAECLADVLAWEQPTRRFGIAGGLTPTERQRLHLAQPPGGEVA